MPRRRTARAKRLKTTHGLDNVKDADSDVGIIVDSSDAQASLVSIASDSRATPRLASDFKEAVAQFQQHYGVPVPVSAMDSFMLAQDIVHDSSSYETRLEAGLSSEPPGLVRPKVDPIGVKSTSSAARKKAVDLFNEVCDEYDGKLWGEVVAERKKLNEAYVVSLRDYIVATKNRLEAESKRVEEELVRKTKEKEVAYKKRCEDILRDEKAKFLYDMIALTNYELLDMHEELHGAQPPS